MDELRTVETPWHIAMEQALTDAGIQILVASPRTLAGRGWWIQYSEVHRVYILSMRYGPLVHLGKSQSPAAWVGTIIAYATTYQIRRQK